MSKLHEMSHLKTVCSEPIKVKMPNEGYPSKLFSQPGVFSQGYPGHYYTALLGFVLSYSKNLINILSQC